MSHPEQHQEQLPVEKESLSDGFAAIAVIAIVVTTVCFWLHSL